MAQHWSTYWQSALSLNSFSEGEMAAGYQGELKDFWYQIFSCLPAAAEVLDVGTGNGALALMLLQYADASGSQFTVRASDAAEIDKELIMRKFPALRADISRIDFYPETKIESLPFADGSLSLITSQFALEYAQPSQAVQSCMRVLKPAGRLEAVIHHAETPLLQQSRQLLQLLTAFTTPDFLSLLAKFKESVLQLASDNSEPAYQQFEVVNRKLLETARQLHLQAEQLGIADDFQDVLAKFAACFVDLSLATPDKLAFFLTELGYYRLRLADQIAAAWDVKKCEYWVSCFARYKCKVNCEPLYLNKELFGWHLSVLKQ